MKNQLLRPFEGTDQSIPFSNITISDYKPAIEEAVTLAKKEIEAIKSNPDEPNFENTIAAYERSGLLLGNISSIFFNLNSANTSDEMQRLAQEIAPILTDYSNEIQLDSELFARIDRAYNNKSDNSLDPESTYLKEKIYRGFIRNGAKLNPEDKNRLSEINKSLSKLSLKFSENVLKDSNTFELWIEDENDLAGMPESEKQAAKMMAKAKNRPEAWLVNLDYPSYLPFMKYAENRSLREKLYRAFNTRGCQDNEFNNEENIRQLVQLRKNKAELLGYTSHAAFTLEERMAKSAKHVYQLWEELLEVALPKAQEEIKEIQKISDELNGPKPIQSWDFSFYAEKLRTKKFSINDELLKPYFKLENVIDGAFKTAQKLFGLEFSEVNHIDKYHPDVKTYNVTDHKGNHVSLLYADFFPRSSKRNGAWMTSYRGQNKYDEIDQRPIISIVCNFTKPTEEKPSLLTFNEVTTLFHEFGHALHGMLANGHYESLSGTSVFWDFVELPSQLMENWCYEKECLELFAYHFETGELIPQDLIQKIKDSVNFLSAYQTVRQVSLGQLDMAWHTTPDLSLNIFDFEDAINKPIRLLPKVERTGISGAFSHIFSGGYSAGYYSYKWAEVLEADAFEYFKENGIFNTEIASSFKENILSKGGSADPMHLYKAFRGQEPNTNSLLRKSGLLES